MTKISRKRSLCRKEQLDCPVFVIRDVDMFHKGGPLWRIMDWVWFTRKEAEDHLESHNYHFTKRAHVYSYGAKGALKELLDYHTEEDD